ncbi:MAG: trypsin-like peptidase domain-containing protein [bacterium]
MGIGTAYKAYTKAKPEMARATLEYLTGPARGTATWIGGDAIDVSISDIPILQILPAQSEPSAHNIIARFHRAENSYEVEAISGNSIWINGERVTSKLLKPRDMIEFGENGPLCRFNLHRDDMPLRKTVADIFYDCVDYARVSRRPISQRMQRAAINLFHSLASQTTWLFRLGFTAILLILSAAVFQQMHSANQLRAQIESGDHRLEEFAGVLARAREEALRPGDLAALRKELSRDMSNTTQRISALEARSEASARIITTAASSVVFLQGAYGYREIETGRMLRHAVDDDGKPLLNVLSQPMLTLEGEGPVAERQFTGTAFIVSESGALLTNRHVAIPWEHDSRSQAMEQRGMEAELLKFIGYLPGVVQPFEVTLAKASNQADLAVLTCSGITQEIPRLVLGVDSPNLGDEVIVMGYPTGLRSMLAQTGSQFVDRLREDETQTDFWAVANRLSEGSFIHPLSSRGIVAQVTQATVVYDADTTHGGSGGPVLNTEGKVVAVNAAIIPDYSGSNLGVPVAFVRQLLEEAGITL